MTRSKIEADLLRLATEMGAHLTAFPRGPDARDPGQLQYLVRLSTWTHRRDDMHQEWERLCRALAAIPITLDPVTPVA